MTDVMPPTWKEAQEQIEEAATAGRASRALRLLKPWLSGEEPITDEAGREAALTALARLAPAKFGQEAASAAVAAADAPSDPAAVYRLGHAMVEEGATGIAAGVLEWGRQLAPGDRKMLAELVAALELRGRNREAVAVLAAAPELVDADPLLLYLLAFNTLLTGDVEGPRRLLPRLLAAEDDRMLFMGRRINGMVERADAIRAHSALDSSDLRGWHYVLTGGLLLHLARGPEAEGGAGRYGRTWDSEARVLEGLHRLRAVLDVWGIEVPRVLFPPERNTEILANAAAKALDVTAEKWFGEDRPGLIVVYDAELLIPESRSLLVHHRPQQPFFVQAASARVEHRAAPDLLSYAYGENTTPWGPGWGPDSEPIPAAEGPAEEIAAAVSGAELERGALDDLEVLTSLARALGDLPADSQPAAFQSEGQRERLWVGSPVA